MRRKTLLILALSVLLVVPAVMAAASGDVETVGTAGVTVQVREQAQNRDCGECVNGNQATTPAATGDQVQIRDRDQVRTQDPALDSEGVQIRDRDRDQVRDQTNCDGEALQLRQQVRTEAQLENAVGHGEQKGYGPGAGTGNGPFGEGSGTGSGPIHEGPEDGTGNQFGPDR